MSKRSRSQSTPPARHLRQRRLFLETLEAREVFAAGDLDTSFDTDGFNVINSQGSDSGMEVHTVSSGIGAGIYVGNSNGLITKFTLNGALDTTYGTTGQTTTQSKAWTIDSSGAAVILTNQPAAGQNEIRVRRFTQLGDNFDTTFATGVNGRTIDFLSEQTNGAEQSSDNSVDVEVDSAGKIWVLGVSNTTDFDPPPGNVGFHVGHSAVIARLTTSGAFDTTFGSGNDGKMAIEISNNETIGLEVRDLVLLPSGGALVLGVVVDASTGTTVEQGVVFKVTSAGAIDTTFGTNGRVNLGDISNRSPFEGAVNSAGEIYISAYKQNAGANRHELSLMKLAANGSFATFGTGGSVDNIYQSPNINVTPGEMGLAVQADGKVILSYDNHNWKVARYAADGTLDSSWGTAGVVDNTATILAASSTSTDPNPQSVDILSSGQIIVAGRAGASAPFKSIVAKYIPASASVSSQVTAFTYLKPAPSTEIFTNDVTVSWSGTATGGATITGYDIYYKVGANAEVLWQPNVTTTSAVFNLNSARRQDVTFYSRAHDSLGGIEAAPASPDATMNYAGAPYQNPLNKNNVDGLGNGTEIGDLLALIFEYNNHLISQQNGNIILPPVRDYTVAPYPDITGNNVFDINDILAGIFAYNNGGGGGGESAASGESAAVGSPVVEPAPAAVVTATTAEESSAADANPPAVSDSALLALFACTTDDDE